MQQNFVVLSEQGIGGAGVEAAKAGSSGGTGMCRGTRPVRIGILRHIQEPQNSKLKLFTI
jgi:hypothetical protein